jgi:hypothetical protein
VTRRAVRLRRAPTQDPRVSRIWPDEDRRSVERIIARMGPRDRRAAIMIVSRVGEVAAQEGQAAALRLVDEIIGIVMRPDADN